MVALGFFDRWSGAGTPLNGFFISFIGWWLLGSARASGSWARARQSLDGVRRSPRSCDRSARRPGWITVRAFAEHVRQRPPRLGVAARAAGTGATAGCCSGDAIGVGALPAVGPGPAPGRGHAHLAPTTGAAPDEDALDVMTRTGGKQVILVVDGGRTVGAVLPADLEALVRMGRRGPVPSTWLDLDKTLSHPTYLGGRQL